MEIAEATPGVRLTVDVFWGESPEFPFSASDFVIGGLVEATDEVMGVRFFLGDSGGLLLTEPTFLLVSRFWPEGLELWDGGWLPGDGVFLDARGVFSLDESYPGDVAAPSLLPDYPGLDSYGARFVFGEPYPADQPSVVPEGKVWFSLIPLGLAVGAVIRRRRQQAAA